VPTTSLFTRFLSVGEGDRIAQLIIERIYTPEISEVEVGYLSPLKRNLSAIPSQELEDTIRGNGGFGSTGGHVGL